MIARQASSGISLGWQRRQRLQSAAQRAVTTAADKNWSRSSSDPTPRRLSVLGENADALKPSTSRAASHLQASTSEAKTLARSKVKVDEDAADSAVPQDRVLKGRFVIPADEVKQHLRETGLDMEPFLFSLIQPASQLARPPISSYFVGSVALGSSGNVYVGVNLEFPRAPLNNSVHSEQFALVNALHHGESSIKALAVSAAPCGHCRQFYAEVSGAESIHFMFGRDSRPKALADLLPERFGPADLQHGEPFPLLLEPQQNKVALRRSCEKEVAAREKDRAFQRAAKEAVLEAVRSYAPYTGCAAGAAIITKGGLVYSGGCVESCAYNPTISPFHAAIIDAVSSGMGSYDEIQEVVLAEVRGAAVKYRSTVQLLLRSIAPKALLTQLQLQLTE